MIGGGLYVLLVLLDAVVGLLIISRGSVSPPGIYQSDASRGYALVPHFSGIEERAGRRYTVGVNSHGYRGDEWIFDGLFRVMVVGSSATYGAGLPIEQGFPYKIAQTLDGRARIYNAAVYGYGPPHCLASIKKLCQDVRPNHIVYFHEYKMTRWDFLIADSGTVVNGVVVKRYADYGVKRLTEEVVQAQSMPSSGPYPSAGINALGLLNLRAFLSQRQLHPRQLAERLYGLDRLSTNYLSRYKMTSASAEFPTDNPTKAAGLIVEMQQAASRCGAGFTMVVLPSGYEGYYGVREPATERILTALAGTEVPVLDLRVHTRRGQVLNLPGDDYFDAPANDWIAEIVARYLDPVVKGPRPAER